METIVYVLQLDLELDRFLKPAARFKTSRPVIKLVNPI